jgi:hypothetical protein
MNPVGSPNHRSRRPLAVAIWSLQVLAMGLPWYDRDAPTGLGTALGIMFCLSALSSAALLLIDSHEFPEFSDSRWGSDSHWGKYVPLVVTLLVLVSWSILLGDQASTFRNACLTVMAVFSMGFALIRSPVAQRWTLPRPRISTQIPLVRPLAAETERAEIPSSEVEVKVEVEVEVEVNGFQRDGVTAVRLAVDHAVDEDPLAEDAADEEQSADESPLIFDTLASDVTQWLTRSQSAGVEQIKGGMRVEFAPGQRDATIHLAFCPPFSRTPQVVTEDVDGASLEIRVAACFPFGARLTVRRPPVRRPPGAKIRETLAKIESYRVGFVASADSLQRVA